MYSRTTTWVFRAGPIVALAAVLCAGLARAAGGRHVAARLSRATSCSSPICSASGRFFTMAAALDTGSSFEGMGASREAAFSALAEPALFLALAILCIPAGTRVVRATLGRAALGDVGSRRIRRYLTAALALFVVLLAENSRIPVDDPNTHLELTMVHEVMVLDHSGPDLGFILYGGAIKLFVIGALLVHLLLPMPAGGGWRGILLLCGASSAWRCSSASWSR